MKIVAALCWYDEPAETLERCIASLAGVVDDLVAIDGRWALHADGAPAVSPIEQRVALEYAVAAAGLDTAGLYAYHRVWPDQVTKRACLMALASERADWILVIDADEYVTHVEHEELHAMLETTQRKVGTVLHANRRPGSKVPLLKRRIRRLYPAGTTVVEAHNGYRLGDAWLHGDPTHVAVEQAFDVSRFLQLEHDKVTRPESRRHDRAVYRSLRSEQMVEAW